ncbi:Desmethyl-deoxy-podophyllotoxin synthase, partial [Linum grandiflorum]
QVLGGFSLADIFPSSRFLRIISGTEKELRKLHKEADVILQSIVDDHLQRRRSPERSNKNITGDDCEDLIDVLLNYTENQSLSFPFTHVELKAVILDIFLAGSDTSSIVVEWAMSELLRHPEEMEKAQKEMRHLFDAKGKIDETNLDELQYLPLIVKETLRLHPPGPLFLPRESRETIVIGGYQIPAKSRVSINAWAIGRDPRYWNDPDKFMPSRFENSTVDYKGSDFQLIPFGSGRRICPGMQFGVIMVHLLLANLLYHFDWKIPNQENPRDLDMSEDFGASIGRKHDLYVTPVLYCPK